MRRRDLLRSAGLLALAGCAPTAPPLPPPTVTDSVPNRPVNVERVWSAARGREVSLAVMRPPAAGEWPVCVMLHGRGAGASMPIQLGVPDLLESFAVVSLDGGDSYWVPRDPADDPQRMLTDELPGWLSERGLGAPFGALGISMGAYGALNYARAVPGLTVAAVSPALFETWSEAESRDAFAGEEAWSATDPLRHPPANTSVGVWCGTEDPFIDAVRRFVEVAEPEKTVLEPGAHDSAYWTRELPDIIAYLGERAG